MKSISFLFIDGNLTEEDCTQIGFEFWGSACYKFVGDDTRTQENAFQQCKQFSDVSV